MDRNHSMAVSEPRPHRDRLDYEFRTCGIRYHIILTRCRPDPFREPCYGVTVAIPLEDNPGVEPFIRDLGNLGWLESPAFDEVAVTTTGDIGDVEGVGRSLIPDGRGRGIRRFIYHETENWAEAVSEVQDRMDSVILLLDPQRSIDLGLMEVRDTPCEEAA